MRVIDMILGVLLDTYARENFAGVSDVCDRYVAVGFAGVICVMDMSLGILLK